MALGRDGALVSAPKRVQMTRRRPWRADNPDAVRVDRNTKWGNPYRVGGTAVIHGPGGERQVLRHMSAAIAVHLYRLWVWNWDVADSQHEPLNPAELRGKDLACWCPLDQPCHADVLLELANPSTEEGQSA